MKVAHIKNGFIQNISVMSEVPESTGEWTYMEATEARDAGYILEPKPLAILKSKKVRAVNARTSRLINVGYGYVGKVFSASSNHQTWALGVLSEVNAGIDLTGTTIPTKDDMDYHVIVDNDDAVAMASACIQHVKGHLSSGATLKKQISDSTTNEQLSAIVDNR